MVERGEHLGRSYRKSEAGDEGDPRRVSEHAGRSADERRDAVSAAMPSAIQPVHSDQKPRLHDGSGLGNEKLHSEHQCGQSEVTQVGMEQKSSDEKTRERKPGRTEENRQEVDVRKVDSAHAEAQRPEEGPLWTQFHRSKQRIHSEQAEVNVYEDVQPVPEVVVRKQDEPGERIEDLVFGIRGDWLASMKVAIPQRQLAAQRDLAVDLLGRVVIARQVAHVEVAEAEENVAEEKGGQENEQRGGEAVVTTCRPLHRVV